jgi:uncharacterized repeat protein (TIGR01451 family)
MNIFSKMKGMFARAKECVGKSKIKKVAVAAAALMMLSTAVITPTIADEANSGTPRFNFMKNDLEMLTAANYSKGQPNWSDPVTGQYKAEAGDEVVFRFYFHNGMENTTAHNVILRALLPTEASNQARVLSSLDSAETDPITDTVVDGKIIGYGNGYAEVDLASVGRLEYVPGSTKIWREYPDQWGVNLPDGITSQDGINIGNVQGCWQYAGYVTFKAVVKSPAEISIAKFIAYPGTNSWNTILQDAKENETIAYKIRVKNDGQSAAPNVLVKDMLPSNVTYIPGTTVFYGPNTPPDGYTMPDGITGNGMIVEIIKPGLENAISFVFQAKIGKNLTYGPQGVWEGVNWGQATYGSQTVKAQAKVTVIGKASIKVDKTVWEAISNQWVETNHVKLGDTITYRIIVTNTGDRDHNNLVVNDVIPVYTRYINGSTKVNGVTVTDGITESGINLGMLKRGASTTIIFRVKTVGCPPLGDYTLTNTAYATTNLVTGISDIAKTILRMDPVQGPTVS